ncbi:MAG: TIGR02301 family protein [Rhizobiales bacterium]|jgi:uncharacterized protein (TIGR02301 family)|nr:TIGR02301 family protein [Hyphomicrobiales bacterium]
MLKRILTIVAVALLVSGQSPRRGATATPPNAPSQALQGGPAPFDSDLMRLAEILGALHYLRALCGANEGSKWRDQMQALLEAEAQTGDKRTRMVGNFNRGFHSFQQTYRTCTPAATIAVRRYLDEGARISREITARYTN